MTAWLVPLCLFWILAAGYIGGGPVRLDGGTAGRQVIGLVAALVLFLAVWGVARLALAALLSPGPSIVGATIIAGVLLPLATRVAFRALGVRVQRASAQR